MKLSLTVLGNTVRLMALDGREVAGYHSILFNPVFLRQGQVVDAEALAKVIRLAMQGKSWQTGRVLAAVPNSGCQSKVLSLPVAREVKPEEVIPREARRIMGVSLERDYLFWQGLPQKGQYFVVAAPREALANFIEMLRLAGLKPRQIDTSALALTRAINQPNAVIACGESNEVTVIIVIDFVPLVIRSQLLGEAPQPGDVVADQLVETLEHTVTYYNEAYRNNPLTAAVPLFLCGASIIEGELTGEVEKRTGLQVQPLKSPVKAPEDFPLSQFMVNLGLIMKEW